MLDELAIIVENKEAFVKLGELFQLGVPFPQKLIFDADQLVLLDKQLQVPLAFSYQVLGQTKPSSFY